MADEQQHNREGTAERTEVDDTFMARRLQVTDIPGTVQVRMGETATMRVQITGPKNLVERIQREVIGDCLHISGPRLGGSGGTTVISNSRGGRHTVISSGPGSIAVGGAIFGSVRTGPGGVFVSGGDVVISGGRVISGGEDVTVIKAQEDVRVVVDVPAGTPITIDEGLFGSYEIGDIEGPLDLRLKGGGNVAAGRVGPTRVSIHGSSDVRVASVNGRALNVAIQGSGDVTVRDGQVDNLDVTIQGSGDVVYGGTARSANLTIHGSGDIRVNQVTDTLNKHTMGIGDIDVHVPPRRDPGSFWD